MAHEVHIAYAQIPTVAHLKLPSRDKRNPSEERRHRDPEEVDGERVWSGNTR